MNFFNSSQEDAAVPLPLETQPVTDGGNLSEDLRFADPVIQELVQLHRMRRRWTKARNALLRQAKALCRSFLGGDKVAATKAFDSIVAGSGDAILGMAVAPFVHAMQRFDSEIEQIERHLVKLAKQLPIASWVDSVSGLGHSSISHIIGEAGDLSKYPTVSGVWKRLGLAVIDGERQRKCTDPVKALAHGYSPERRAVVWVMADALSRRQRTWADKETGAIKKEPGPYGVILEFEKAKALAKGWPALRAERHAKRLMSKALLRDMVLEWRRALK